MLGRFGTRYITDILNSNNKASNHSYSRVRGAIYLSFVSLPT
jgi:hypothetical protein